jgi:hypothetical protein
MARMSESTVAALFDLRSVIALLFLVYGLVLTVLGAVGESQSELDKAGGIDINLWTGIVMLLMAIGFALWVWLRPPVLGTPRTEQPDLQKHP